jgi:hypothetical protein
MRHAMKMPAAFAVAALLGAIGTPARADKPGQSEKPAHPNAAANQKAGHPGNSDKPEQTGSAKKAGQPGNSEKAGQPAAPGNAGREKAEEAREGHGRSVEAREAAPGQNHGPSGKHDSAGKPDKPNDQASEETRAQRRRERRAALQQRFGLELLQRPPIRAELETHAWRVARLERMRVLAEAMTDAEKRKKTLARLEKLATKENERHERQLTHLKAQTEKAAAGGKADVPDKAVAKADGLAQHADKAGGAR